MAKHLRTIEWDDRLPKGEQLRYVIRDVVSQRQRGKSVSDAEIIARHPQLMPDLGESLHALGQIQNVSRLRDSVGHQEGNEPERESSRDLDLLSAELPDYRILERIQQGGQGIVYRAVQNATERIVAIKVLRSGPFATAQERKFFEREVRIISRMNHPNIVTLHDAGIVSGRCYFVMQFIEGVPIDDHVLVEGLGPRQIVEMFVIVCEALEYAHRMNVIHRDLKPSNILVDHSGQPQIVDFGLAKDTADLYRSGTSGDGQVVGTLPYLSPEQARGDSQSAGAVSDVYTLGVILFRLVTEQFPYPIPNDVWKLREIIQFCEPMSLRKAMGIGVAGSGALSRIDSDLEAIVRKSLAKERTFRYQSAQALAFDLKRYLVGDPVEARHGAAWYLFQNKLRRYKLGIAAASGVVTVLAILVAALLFANQRVGLQRTRAQAIARLAQDTVNLVATEIDESVSPLAGGLGVRDRLLTTVSHTLAELTPLLEAEGDMTDLLSAVREKQGDIAYAKGDREAAGEHYQAFLDLTIRLVQESGQEAERQPEVAHAHGKLGKVSDNPDSHFGAAISTLESLLNQDPENPELQFALCETLLEYGDVLFLAGRYEAAEGILGPAFKYLRSNRERGGDDDRWDRLLASACSREGKTLRQLGKGLEGIPLLTEAVGLRDRLLAACPADTRIRRDLLHSHLDLADVRRNTGDHEAALAQYRNAVAIGELLTAMDPSVPAWQQDLFVAIERLSRLHLTLEDIAQAEITSQKATDVAQALYEGFPDEETAIQTRAHAHILRGRVLQAQGRNEQALQEYLAAVERQSDLVELDPKDPSIRAVLAGATAHVASCYRALGEITVALEFLGQARAQWELLSESSPAVVSYASHLVAAQVNLASLHMKLRTKDHDDEAERLLRTAQARWQEMYAHGDLEGMEDDHRYYTEAFAKSLEILKRRRGRTEADEASSHSE